MALHMFKKYIPNEEKTQPKNGWQNTFFLQKILHVFRSGFNLQKSKR